MKLYTEVLRALREDHDLKQKEVAQIIGTTQQHYSRYETGSYEIPVFALCKLADYYGVSTDYILGRVSYSNSDSKILKEIGNHPVLANIFSDLIDLNNESHKAITEYVSLHKLKEKVEQEK